MADKGRSIVDRFFDLILLLIFAPFVLCIILQFAGALTHTVLVTVQATLTETLPWLFGAIGLAIVFAGISAALALRNRAGGRNSYRDLAPPGVPPLRRPRPTRYNDEDLDD